MKTTVSLHQFRNDFRAVRPDNFSYEGLEVLFDYLEEYEESTGSEIEFDVIALCCDYSEGTHEEIADDYGIDLDGADVYEDRHARVMEWLMERTTVCGETASGRIVYCSAF